MISTVAGESPTSSGISNDIIMGEETIRGMKDLADKLKFAEQESFEAAACVAASDKSAKKEMRRIARLSEHLLLHVSVIYRPSRLSVKTSGGKTCKVLLR